MATPRSPIQAHRIPPAEEVHISSVSETPTISSIVPQYFPPFNKGNLKLWFLQAEAAMRTSSITSDSSRFTIYKLIYK
ncbi:hypothetical protein K0M31_012860 [Melipona bicolor]|uniref:Uncharacterized protein n=1 Tax=Melipona bicolor TaxID=60889 RepID=A0AA40KHD6_9HYME|nr:hypothetical protein K0M31_012860 [Melipona bicolor]